MAAQRNVKSYKLALGFKLVFVLGVTVCYVLIALFSRNIQSVSYDETQSDIVTHGNGRHLLGLPVNITNCTKAAIHEFPPDGFTRHQRQAGWAVLHAILVCYLFILLAVVCDDYFVPAIKTLCDALQMKEDIAGATFMATASSSPELFINCVGTFITEGDIGVGTVVGSAVFNVLAVPACCGLFADMVLNLEWWPITRDSFMYASAVLLLISVLADSRVDMYEAGILVSAYLIYIAVMYFNENITNTVTRIVRMCRKKKSYRQIYTETVPLLQNGDKYKTQIAATNGEITLQDCEDLEESTNIWKWPGENTKSYKCWWILTWPISFLLYITTPDCRKNPRLCPLTFIMCIIWIGSTSYMVAWMITVLGDTLNIPDSVMGLTFLAAGTSVPEAVSSIIVTNQGHGGMGLSSSIGSNTFDILLCLGLPWLIKTWLTPKVPGQHYIIINSSGLNYSAVSLLSTLILFYMSLVCNKFRLDWKIGLTCLLMYMAFLAVASLIELNVFFPVNLPTCDR